MKNIRLQAHRGVASECPENTMAAFRCAAVQGYDVIELDVDFTKDKKIVVLHDKLINRTARTKSGSELKAPVSINGITYRQALKYDFGIHLSNKFKGEPIPLFSDVLIFAKESGIKLKIDNKTQSFPKEILKSLLSEIKDFEDFVSITASDIDFAADCIKTAPEISVDYDGAVTAENLSKLSAAVPKERLTVWLPLKCGATSWVSVPFAEKNSAELVKKYAKLGIWLITNYEDFEKAAALSPDIVETDGTVKPEINKNQKWDMHTHSENSHDSKCPAPDMLKAAKAHGLSGFAVTDHCDIAYHRKLDLPKLVASSVSDAGNSGALKGIEIGEAFYHRRISDNILKNFDFDAVIGSVHTVRFKGYEIPYSQINFSEMRLCTTKKFLEQYFDDVICMIENCDFDILAHLTCPLRYINGKYGMGIDCKDYEDKIKKILGLIIDRKIALEINTSCMHEGFGYRELMPEARIIKMYADMGGYLITTGSDAHNAENSALYFNELYGRLKKEFGFRNIYYYKNRFAVQCALTEETI